MNILLLNGLPEEYEGIAISTDFRNMIQVDMILHDPELNEVEKVMAALHQLYPQIPQDIPKAIKGLEWFFARGQEGGGKKENGGSKKAFDFEQDASLIYAAFYAAYGISLTTVDYLHWWEFMALFDGLPEDAPLKRIIYWRTADTSGMSKEERKHVLKMRKLFALKESNGAALSVEEINRQTKERVARRFEAAQRALEGTDTR